jgi:glycosyltransferase involved in cell wall biosynthesis
MKSWLTFDDFKKRYEKVPVIEFSNSVNVSIPNPTVSVLIITYNHTEFIHQAIESVLAQETNFPFEIILCEDESKDGTRETCIEFAKKYPEKIKLFLNSRANNISVLGKPCGIFQFGYGLFNFRGQYFAELSGDDYWTDPNKLQLQYNFMVDNPALSYCYHSWVEKNENENQFYIENQIVNKSDMPLTLFGKNIFQTLPNEFFEVLQEDTFITNLLLVKGESAFISTIKPSVYRIHGVNLWGLNENLFKKDSRIHTWVKLSEAFDGTPQKRKFNIKSISAIFEKYEYLQKEGKVKHSRFNGKVYAEMKRNKLLTFYMLNFLKKKLVKQK